MGQKEEKKERLAMNHLSIVRIVLLCIVLSCALLTACADSAGEVYDGLGEQEGVGEHYDPQAGGGNAEISVASDMGKNIGGGATDNLQTNGGNASGSSENSIGWDVAVDTQDVRQAEPEEAIQWVEPALEALVRAKLARPTGVITKSDLEYFWGIELFGESHIFFNGSGGYFMTDNPDFRSETISVFQEGIISPDDIVFALSTTVDPALIRDGTYSVKGIPHTRGSIASLADFANFPNLKHLYVFKNDMDDLSGLSTLEHLNTLRLIDNNIKDISGLAGLREVYYLDLVGNQIEDISPLSDLTQLWHLSLQCNNIKNTDALASMHDLEWLILMDNPITGINRLGGLKRLTYLNISNTPVNDISSLCGLEKLRGLGLKNLDTESIDLTPISNLANLNRLDIRQDKAKLLNLQALYGLAEMQWIHIRPNVGISENDIAELMEHLPRNCRIIK